MIKTTNINSVLTPAPNIALAEAVLGKVPAPIQTQFSPGSLVASLFSTSVAPLGVFVTRDAVVAFDLSDEANGSSADVAGISGILTFLGGNAHVLHRVIEAIESPGKSKPLTTPDFVLTIDATIDGDPADAYISDLMVPEPPRLSALSIINRIESVAVREGQAFVMYIDQVTETIHLYVYATRAAATSALNGARNSSGAVVSVAFDTPVSDAAPGSPKHGFE